MAPILILNASQQPYLSVAKYYGGIKAWGHEYVMIYENDCLIRKNYLKVYKRFVKQGKNFQNFVEYVSNLQQS